MTRLSDTQLTTLSAAAQRPDGNLLPLPGLLRGGAAGKVVGALLARGLIREQIVDSTRTADSALNTVWRNLEGGRGVLLLITDAGLDALGIAGKAHPGAAGDDASAPMGADTAAPGTGARALTMSLVPPSSSRREARSRSRREICEYLRLRGRPGENRTPNQSSTLAR